MKGPIPRTPPTPVISHAKRTGLLLLFAAVSLCSAQPTRADDAGTLIHPRFLHTATRLADGRVLLVGGLVQGNGGFVVSDSCELYNPATNTWTATGSLNVARDGHEAVLLADGRVLVAAGAMAGSFPTKTVEIYDPASGTWSFTKALLNLPGGNLVLLADGRVLAAGGSEQKAANCELYDPNTGTWSLTGSLNIPRGRFQATRLSDGRVLIAGGTSPGMPGFLGECELYDPVTGTWSLTGALNRPRFGQEQVLLNDGRVLVAGGVVGRPSRPMVTRIAEIFDPNSGLWTLSHPLVSPRSGFTANLLNDGNVFAAGGNNGEENEALTSIEDFEPATGRWHLLTTTLATPRRWHTSTTLLDGSVLITGGIGNLERPVRDAEIFVTPQ